jgi:Spy/CpxP family protein refolding chaperone
VQGQSAFAGKMCWLTSGGAWWIAAILTCLCLVPASAQKVIPSDREGLSKGLDMDLAAIAESNNLPNPGRVLALKNELGLTRDQVKKTEALEKVAASAAVAKGGEIIQAEEELAAMFETGGVNEKALRSKLEQIGKARAELRFIHLQAHLRMKQVLTPDQVKQYIELKLRESKREN